MRRYLAAFILSFTMTFALMFGLVGVANASTETTSSSETFSWSGVLSKALFTTLVAAPAVVYFSINKKDE